MDVKELIEITTGEGTDEGEKAGVNESAEVEDDREV